jgi:hypothetical protein
MRGPLVSLRRRLNGTRSLASRGRTSCSATCTAPCAIILCAPGLQSKARFLHLSAPLLSPSSLSFASRRPPLFQAPSTAAGSHCCRLVHLHVVLGWGSARQASHRSELIGRRPSMPFPSDRPHTTMESTITVRFHPHATPNWNGLGSVPDPFATGRRPPVDRILPGITFTEEGEKDPLFFVAVGRKALWA